ncbi:NAD(P)-binding protein [Aureobasidium pullulans]|nr:NAD(P)-binding protein [Aureobasidium pullulans]THX12980.1 NAD(P)-binding protein [Aureobasidium pullulans]THY12643.1 NAD(P)-binding protein [Aureobasidium pullulans]
MAVRPNLLNMPDFNNDLILITCASGKQSSALIPHLLKSSKKLRLQCNSSKSKQMLSSKYPGVEVVQADMASPSDCHRILDGVTTCHLVDPPFHPHETQLGINMIDAAISQQSSSSGPFTHMIYSSVIFPHLRKLLNHDCKRYTEEYLIESGLNYTILQPTHMMEMLPLALLMSQKSPIYQANWNPDTKFSFVTVLDVAEAAAKVITHAEEHYFATYQLVSTALPLSYTQVCELVGKHIGKDVAVKQKSFQDAVNISIKMINGGKEPPAATKEIGARMFLYYNERGLVGNNNVLGWLLGREPTSYESWLKLKVEEINGQKA